MESGHSIAYDDTQVQQHRATYRFKRWLWYGSAVSLSDGSLRRMQKRSQQEFMLSSRSGH
eukprot:scaffold120726_cov13-Prasinocladus_malaysianus.AAC.1